MTQREHAGRLLTWIEQNGGSVHPLLELRQDYRTGLSLFSSEPIEIGSTLISCPFDLAITPDRATAALVEHRPGLDKELAGWNERMRIAAYLMLHWQWLDRHSEDKDPIPIALRHMLYVQALPPESELTTPLFFSPEEMCLLEGTNLHGGTKDLHDQWGHEYRRVQAVLGEDGITWQRYLAAATYISSRAFPSRLLALSGTVESHTSDVGNMTDSDESHPVLLPGVDLFNHARAQPVTWLSSNRLSSVGNTACISLITDSDLGAKRQVFNNYGLKSNEELLLGYGFVLDPNPDDIVVLRLGSSSVLEEVKTKLRSRGLDATQRFTVERDGIIPKPLLEVMRVMLGGDADAENDGVEDEEEDLHAEHEKEMKAVELELDVLGSLGAMLEDKLEKIPDLSDIPDANIRPHVRSMCELYRQGQRDILETALERLGERNDQLESLLDQGMGGCPCCS